MSVSLIVQLAICGVALLAILLAGWEDASRSGEAPAGRSPRPLVRLALAIGAAAALPLLVTALATRPRPWTFSPAATAAVLAIALVGMAFVLTSLVRIGKGLGKRGRPPIGLRWLLAPARGWILWAHWVHDLFRSRARRAAAERESAETAGAPVAADPSEGVRDLASLTVGEIMTPRSEVATLEAGLTVAEAIARGRARPHGVYPVFGESLEQPLGVVRVLDLARAARPDVLVGDLVHPIPVVPETIKCLSLLVRLREAEIPAALVVDEFGSTAGFLTVEDLMEVLVGDLEGEHEIVRRRVAPIGERRFRLEGSCRVDEFNAAIATPLVPDGDYETVAGAFLERFGRIPAAGDKISLPHLTLTVEAATDRRILALVAETSPAEEEDED